MFRVQGWRREQFPHDDRTDDGQEESWAFSDLGPIERSAQTETLSKENTQTMGKQRR
jgi:hypothetical protein